MSVTNFSRAIPSPRLTSTLTAAMAVGSILLACEVGAQGVEPPADVSGIAMAAAGSRADQLDTVLVQGVQEQNALLELRDVPKPVSVVLEDDLQTFDLVSIQDVLRRLGNVRWNPGNPRTSSFSLRGLTGGPGNDKIDPSIGMTVDGIPYAYLSLAAGTDLVDIESVNVTRGPQGTLGAKPTSVGQINVITRRPSFIPEASASLTVGQDNALRAQAQIGGPVIDDVLAWRATFTRNQQDGAWDNQYPDLRGLQSHVNSDRTYGRLQLLFTPSEIFSARLLYDHQPKGDEFINGLSFSKDTPDNYANGAPVNKTNNAFAKLGRRWFTQQSAYTAEDYFSYPVYLDTSRAITTSTQGALLDLDWKLGHHRLTSLSSWRDHYFIANNDDGTPFDISRNGGYITTYWQFSQELRLSSSIGNLVDYQAGVFYLKNKYDSFGGRTRYGNDAGAYQANVAEYARLDADSSGRELLTNSLARLYRSTQSYLDNESKALFAQLDWHLSEPLTLTTGIRGSREDRRLVEGQLVYDNGYGAALNPVAVNNVRLGGFASNAAGVLAASNAVEQLLLADSVASQYFGVASTGVPGDAYNSLTGAQKLQVAAAKTIRQRAIGTLWNPAEAEPYSGDLITGQVSLRNRFTEQLTGYVTWQYGEKPGIAQFNGVHPAGSPLAGEPRSLPAGPERTSTYEAGIRSSLLNDRLALNANVFHATSKDFQQTVYFVDELLTELDPNGTGETYYSSGVGNVGRVRSQGVELDLIYSGFRYTDVRFSGAYTDARYKDHRFSGQPAERANEQPAFRDVTGYVLPNAPKWQFNASANYRRPVFGDKVFHAGLSYTFSSRENGDAALSDYGWSDAYGLADLSIGLGRVDEKFDVNLIVRNLLDEDYGDIGWSSYNINQRPRWIGVVFSGRLY